MFTSRKLMTVTVLMLAFAMPVLASCTDLTLINQAPLATRKAQGNGVLGWPFDTTQGRWNIENGYNWGPALGGDHSGYELYSFDFQRSDGATTGQQVLSPVTGESIDFGSAAPGDFSSGHCARLAIVGTAYAGYYVMVCHLNSVKTGHITKGDVLGTVSGGPNGNHIHMTLYFLKSGTADIAANASHRQAIPFSVPWTIAGCDYPWSTDGRTNQWAKTPVPCTASSVSSPASSPTPKSLVGAINEFPLGVESRGVAAGPDGTMWFSDRFGSRIGRITATGTVSYDSIPRPQDTGDFSPGPSALAVGPDGNLWFAEFYFPVIGRMTPAGAVTLFDIPSGNFAESLIAGPDQSMWFSTTDAIGHVTMTGDVTEYPSASLTISDITAGPDGNVWFTDFGNDNVGRITPSGAIKEYPTSGGAPLAIAAGPDGNIWYSTDDGLWRISTSGSPIGSVIAAHTDYAGGLVFTPDGNIWTCDGAKVYRATPAGAVTTFAVPTPNGGSSGSITMAVSSDGTIWFTEPDNKQIAHIT